MDWEKEMRNFDREVRRSNQRQKKHSVRIPPHVVELIRDDYTLPNLETLNELEPEGADEHN